MVTVVSSRRHEASQRSAERLWRSRHTIGTIGRDDGRRLAAGRRASEVGRTRPAIEEAAMRRVGLAITIAAPLAVLAVAGRRTAGADRNDLYDRDLPPEPPANYGAAYGGAPIYFHRSETFSGFFSASAEAVEALLPSRDLHLVRLPNGRAVVLVVGIQHTDITASGVDGFAALPYGEVLVGALVTRRPVPRGLALVSPASLGLGTGAFVLHLPVTSRVARDVGRLVWGYPKFVADMEFADSVRERSVRLSEGGRHLLTLTVRPSGRPSRSDAPLILYSVLGTDLVEHTCPCSGIAQGGLGSGRGSLELGDHPLADGLRALALAPDPFMTTLMTRQRLLMPRGIIIGRAERYSGYIGEERDLGRYVVRYPHAAPIDQYSPYAATAGPGAARDALSGDREGELVTT
jgi:hypothetical protein